MFIVDYNNGNRHTFVFYKVNKLFIVASKHNDSFLNFSGYIFWSYLTIIRPKHVAIKIRKTNNLITKYTIVVLNDNYKQFFYLVNY
jgi:hypothetical protein